MDSTRTRILKKASELIHKKGPQKETRGRKRLLAEKSAARALQITGGNVTKACLLTGTSRPTFYRTIKRYPVLFKVIKAARDQRHG